jgi:3-oxoadipate enol-lactonase / 4-carboxymuconolactone decarboxylase
MPFATHAGARLYWKSEGERSRPPLLVLNSIGTDMGSWDRALPHLLPHFRVLRMDARGHGASDAPAGEYSLDLLAADAAAVLDAAGVSQAIVCGVSLGGMIAMTLALNAPGRVRALIPACTSPRMDRDTWAARIAAVKAGGTAAIADAALGRFVTPAFTRAHPEVVDSLRATLVSQSSDGYAGCAAAIRDMDLTGRLNEITAPTLVIGAREDVSTPFAEHGQRIVDGVPGAQSVLLDGPHLAQVEGPPAFAAAVVRFVRALDGGPAEADAAEQLYRTGLATRRQVLGDAWVDRSLANRTAFNADFQAMITRIAWNEIWTRPGLDHRTRRLLVLAVTAALGRWEEFNLHVRSGLQQGGFTEDELKETLMQLAIYAGVPAANTAFAEAGRILAELGAEARP